MRTGKGQRKNGKRQNQRDGYGETPKPPLATLDLAKRGQYGVSTICQFSVRVHVFAALSDPCDTPEGPGCTRRATLARVSSVFCWACSPPSGDLCPRTGSVSHWDTLGTLRDSRCGYWRLDSEPRTANSHDDCRLGAQVAFLELEP
jgi:hypothetical protein